MRRGRKGKGSRQKGEISYPDALIGEEEQKSEKSEEKERDRGTEDETSYLDALIGEEEQKSEKGKKRKEIEAERRNLLPHLWQLVRS